MGSVLKVNLAGVLDAAARRLQGLGYNVKVADVVGQQQHQRRVHLMALIGAQIAMRIDQLFVEVVGRRKIGLCVQKFHGVASVAQPVARSKAARMLSGSGLRQRAAMCWSGLIRRSEEHTSELQSLMRISYAVF